MFNFFIEGNPVFMAILTILLAGLFFAAWKAPQWVKEIGKFSLGFGVLSFLFGLRQIMSVLNTQDGISTTVIYGGLKVVLIPLIYGVIIYLVSLIIRMIQKPRI